MHKSIKIKKEDEVIIEQKDLDIVSLLSYGFTVREISPKVQINDRSIENRLAILKNKLNCKNTTHLCSFCIRYKLIK